MSVKRMLKVMSWIAIILGACSIWGGFSEPSGAEASYGFVGGLIFGVEGLLALMYINSNE